MKCYHKELQYIVPKLTCDICKKHIKTGEGLYSVCPEWGRSFSTCEKCYNNFEIDWSMHEDECE